MIAVVFRFVACFPMATPLVHGDQGQATATFLTVRVSGTWTVVDSPNFCCRGELSEADMRRLAECCEAWRSRLRTLWISNVRDEIWTPKCDVCVHPHQAAYNQALNRPSDLSVGSTRMNFDQGRVVFRRIDVRADAGDWPNAALPHELTHVILGERFGGRAIPRWADEGIAMLSESAEKHRERLANLRQLISKRQTLTLFDLIRHQQIPGAQHRNAFYGQSVGLASWFIRRSTPARFADFVDDCQLAGMDQALKRHYEIDGIVALQRDWDHWLRTPDAIEFVSLQLHLGVTPILAANDAQRP